MKIYIQKLWKTNNTFFLALDLIRDFITKILKYGKFCKALFWHGHFIKHINLMFRGVKHYFNFVKTIVKPKFCAMCATM